VNVTRFDSIVFETPDLARLRKFYVEVLGLRVGAYEKAGKSVADESDSYFNLDIGGTLLGFERGVTQTGTIVLALSDLKAALAELAAKGVKPTRAAANFAIIADPDGREIILQA
jgi:catechol 2,3-dioxygenase-like lactoylglutathione lyase family enzyme